MGQDQQAALFKMHNTLHCAAQSVQWYRALYNFRSIHISITTILPIKISERDIVPHIYDAMRICTIYIFKTIIHFVIILIFRCTIYTSLNCVSEPAVYRVVERHK